MRVPSAADMEVMLPADMRVLSGADMGIMSGKGGHGTYLSRNFEFTIRMQSTPGRQKAYIMAIFASARHQAYPL